MSLSSHPLSSQPLSDQVPSKTLSIALGIGIADAWIGFVQAADGTGATAGTITGQLDGKATGLGIGLGSNTPSRILAEAIGTGVTDGNITGLLDGAVVGWGIGEGSTQATDRLGVAIGWGYDDATIGAPDGYGLPTQQAVGVGYSYGTINATTGVITWVSNEGAYSEYTHYPFLEYCALNHQAIACDAGGVYRLGGDRANGQQIKAEVITGLMQPGGTQLSMVDAVIATLEAGNDEAVEMVVRREYNGKLVENVYRPQAMDAFAFRELRATVKRGQRSKYWAFGVRNRFGRYFELDSLLINAATSLRQRK